MSDSEKKLLQIFKKRSVQFGTFQLASGDTSNYYIDGKMTEVFSRGAALIGEVLYERTKDLGIDAIGGLEVGAVPLATAAVIAYDRHDSKMEGFWVRDKMKSHGTKKMIEGNLKHGQKVVIVDDVVTKGTSVIRAIDEVKNLGCEIVQVIAIVDRLAGARELLRKNGITAYRPVFEITDLGVDIDERRPAEVNSC
jgi:orotate phosphoribosyltransferase